MYRVVVKPTAQKEISRLPESDQKDIRAAIDLLCFDPFVGKLLKGKFEGARCIRVWPYRIIYKVVKEVVTVIILRVRHRKDAYR